MVVPALLGAFATFGGGALGAMASNNAATYNYYVDLLNYNLRERERFDSIQQAKRQEADTKLGVTDAAGNRTHFVEGVGWVSDLSDDQALLQELYQNEELQQLQNDLPAKRGILNANVERQGRENTQASALLDAFQRVRRIDPRQLENLSNRASSLGINEAFDTTLQEAMRSSIRQGASNSGKVAADIGAQRAKMLEQAFLNNKLNSRTQSDERYAMERGNAANLYNMFASRASAMPDVAYNPRNIEGMTGAATENAASRGMSAGGALINAFAKQGGSMQRIDPDYGWANMLSQGGQALASAFDVMGANKQRQQAIDAYGGYAGMGDMYKSGVGAY